MPRWLLAFSLSLVLLTTGCAGNGDTPPDTVTERELYQQAREQLDRGNYTRAVRSLELLESRFPFGPYAEQAQLEIIFAYYQNRDNEAAIAAADRFIRLHPQHPNVDYAYYMRGLAQYTQGQGLLERFLPRDETRRDPGPARDSFASFARLLQQFPDSAYAPDARARMIHLRNRLARYEINVANYYLKRQAWLAAANRGRGVVENYPRTPAVPDALAVMVQAYLILGLNDLAGDALTVLRTNYPQHPALDANGDFIPTFHDTSVRRSWLERLTLGLFGRPEPPRFDNRQSTWLPTPQNPAPPRPD